MEARDQHIVKHGNKMLSAPAARSWDYQALLIQETLGSHAGTRPGSAEAQRQMTEAAVATREAASNASALRPPAHRRGPHSVPGVLARPEHALACIGCLSATA